MTLKWAFENSVNVVAARLIDIVTPTLAIQYAQKLGVTSPLEPNLSLALGAVGASPLEMATAYVTIASEGIYRMPFLIRKINKLDNRIIEEQLFMSRRIVDAQSCYLIIDMMRGVIEEGTAKGVRALGFLRPCAGKTGTTDDYPDAWFIGFTPNLVCAVWVGFDDNRIMRDKWNVGITGARVAVPIWTQFMKQALGNKPYSDFPIPPGIEFVEVDRRNGKITDDDSDKLSAAILTGTMVKR